MKILYVSDLFITKDVMEKELLDRFSDIEDLELENLSVDFPEPVLYNDEVKEYNGNEQDIADKIEDIDHLIVHTAPVTKKIMNCAKKLKSISVARGGAVNINLSYATKLGIPVFYTPGRNASATAEFTVGLMLASTRNIAKSHEDTRKGNWRTEYYMYYQSEFELSNKVIGIIGFGNVGSKVCQFLSGFGCEVLVYDPYIKETGFEYAKLIDLSTLLERSDIVSLHMRVTPETTGIVDMEFLKRMKDSAILINSARGPLVKYEDLYAALKDKVIDRVALDTFAYEPIEEGSPLFKLDNVTITNHIAGCSRNTAHISGQMIAKDLRDFIDGKEVENVLNKEVLRKDSFSYVNAARKRRYCRIQ